MPEFFSHFSPKNLNNEATNPLFWKKFEAKLKL